MIGTLSLGLLFTVAVAALVLGTYALARRLLGADHAQETRDLAGSILFRVSSLHGLILALVFSQQMADYHALRDAMVEEASATTDLFYDLDRFGSEAATALRPAVLGYARAVAGGEGAAWRAWETVYGGVLDLAADTPRRAALRAHMLEDVHRVAEMRDRRASHGLKGLAPMFWVASLGGVVLVAATYFAFRPTRRHLVLLGAFGAFTGLILFLTYALSNPLRAPGALAPTAMARFLDAAGG